MTYKFGKYSVSVYQGFASGIFNISQSYYCTVYYGSNTRVGNGINSTAGFSSETDALVWAKKEIEKHRDALRALEV
jgi:hypothetical protein